MYRILIAKPEQKKPLARRMENNMNIKSAVMMEVQRRFGGASTRLHGVMSQKTVISIPSPVKPPHLLNITV
jgi:hypothetical protein